MNALRSILFNAYYVFGSLLCSVLLLWALFLPEKKCAQAVGDLYGAFIGFGARRIMGLRLVIEGMEHLPPGPCIIAAKHQSAYETLTLPFMRRFGYPAIVLKKELTKIPLWGLYPKRMGLIAIDRGQGMAAMRAMIDGCKKALASGRPVVIFPQGTRVAPGAKAPYKAGLAKLYKELDVPVVPLALNTGLFWGRNAFFKKPGTITYKILPPIPPGQPPLRVMEQLEKILEEESDRLLTAARPQAPA